ncbi:hypothetical protein CBR_g41781 [Chara braunii]|uniref:Malic enzyme NAD-binding domain-containing protein n=1 Tax=Chara braunii TaxID=69332 RepID=A0A388LWL3_CHABU|nr:hypothetical protein CBR_g41781 [Chara braunii]|eukprot:GBG86717.1 hypothetical protein CBR_g41781 [Chara braunii]
MLAYRWLLLQGNNAYIFPGIGLGCIISTTRRLRDEMFIAAAEALAEQVTDADRKVGRIYPPFSKIRTISAHIAKAVAVKSYELGLAAKWPRPDNLLALAKSSMYNPRYRPIR